MTGIVNSTGAKSGIIGTTVGTPVTDLSTATFPAGHVVKQSFIGDEISGAVDTDSTVFTSTGIEVSHVTAMSSADSYLVTEFYSGMTYINQQGRDGMVDITMKDASSSTYTSSDSLTAGGYSTAYIYIQSGGTHYLPFYMKIYCGLVTQMGMPSSKSSWAVGDTLYFRLFFKINNSDSRFWIAYINNTWNFSVKEVVR